MDKVANKARIGGFQIAAGTISTSIVPAKKHALDIWTVARDVNVFAMGHNSASPKLPKQSRLKQPWTYWIQVAAQSRSSERPE